MLKFPRLNSHRFYLKTYWYLKIVQGTVKSVIFYRTLFANETSLKQSYSKLSVLYYTDSNSFIESNQMAGRNHDDALIRTEGYQLIANIL